MTGFWDRLGLDEGGLPTHLPIGLNADGQGPADAGEIATYACWCMDRECPLTRALIDAYIAGAG